MPRTRDGGRRDERGRRDDHGRRRVSHSMEAVLTEAVALLDEAGEPALTFRALAARLGGGVASIYWYVASKDELLDRATDHVLADAVTAAEARPASADPVEDLRAIALALFEVIVARPWLGAYFMRNSDVQGNGLRLYELMGQQVLRLDLTQKQRFFAVSAVTGFVVGTAADLGQEPPEEVAKGETTREEYLARFVGTWRALDPARFPFVHDVIEEIAGHDDDEQFRAGLDLILAGLRLQAGA